MVVFIGLIHLKNGPSYKMLQNVYFVVNYKKGNYNARY